MITPAWSSAETGVGVSITSSSQPWKGNCADFRTAASTRSAAAPWAAIGTAPSPIAPAPAFTAARSRLPNSEKISAAAPTSAASPIRLATNFLRAARTAFGRSA